MKILILTIILCISSLAFAYRGDIYADDQLHGQDLIEMVEDEGQEIQSSSGLVESYKAVIECHKDKLNSKRSYCKITK